MRPVWETAVEFEAFVYLKIMNGGDYAPGLQLAVADWVGDQISEPPPLGSFDPHT